MLLRDNVHFYPSPAGLDFSGEINSNSVLVTGSKHVLIDPGLSKRWEELKEKIVADGIDLSDIGLIFCTHSHPDHAEAACRAATELGADLLMALAELDFFVQGGAIFYYRTEEGVYLPIKGNFPVFETPDLNRFIKGFPGPFFFAEHKFRLFLTPGHTPGCMSLHWPDRGLLVTGDVYFPGTIGSVELFGGSPSSMYRSVRLLSGLQDVDLVLCGHGGPLEGRQAVEDNYRALMAEIEDKKAKGVI
ncbi:MAG: MBL fold metallo-hydrolase [Deltaproteobacteria bacterium]|jgi:glyoxylase-like metal-dependent hydrolase (beta-lactamase superfamily II)|nr:MBL fold metallo-hydrolase [Deltaproteobacteria bacterium]